MSFADADRWDLEFWQSQTPAVRLQALVTSTGTWPTRGGEEFEGVAPDSMRGLENLLALLERHEVRYLIVGGLGFVYHARPRHTKHIDLWIEPTENNLTRAGRALAELGSPTLMSPDDGGEIIRFGTAPIRAHRIEALGEVSFQNAWATRVVDRCGGIDASWIGLDALLRIEERIDTPLHQEDVRVLREVKRLRGE